MIREIKQTDFFIKQGATFTSAIVWKILGVPKNLTGFTGRMYLKRTLNGEKLFELTTTNGRLIISPLDGSITMFVSAADTATLSGQYVYDLEMVQGSFVKRILQGTITIDGEVTR